VVISQRLALPGLAFRPMATDVDLDKVLDAIAASIGSKESWPPYPGGYPQEAEAALLDSVFSLSAVYGSAETGTRAVVKRWRDHVGRPLNSLSALVADVEGAGGPQNFRVILKNNAVAVPNSKDQPTKAAAVYGVARTLTQFGVDSADDVRTKNAENPKGLYRAITKERGVGEAGATYFLMLLGIQGVKADVMIRRFVARALDVSEIEPSHSQKLVAAAAGALDADLLSLDHAIWDYESRRSRTHRSGAR
jgi:hypothetical protein